MDWLGRARDTILHLYWHGKCQMHNNYLYMTWAKDITKLTCSELNPMGNS